MSRHIAFDVVISEEGGRDKEAVRLTVEHNPDSCLAYGGEDIQHLANHFLVRYGRENSEQLMRPYRDLPFP